MCYEIGSKSRLKSPFATNKKQKEKRLWKVKKRTVKVISNTILVILLFAIMMFGFGCGKTPPPNNNNNNNNNSPAVPPAIVYEGTSLENAIELEDEQVHTVDISRGAKTYYKSSSEYSMLVLSFDGKMQDSAAMKTAVTFYAESISEDNKLSELITNDVFLRSAKLVQSGTSIPAYRTFYVVIEWYYMADDTNSHLVTIV